MDNFIEHPYFLRFIEGFTKNGFRYTLFAGGAFLTLYVFGKRKYILQKIQQRFPKKKKLIQEITYSILTMGIYALFSILFIVNQNHWHIGQVYYSISDYGIPYFLFSIVVMVVWHDTYFYWTHRWMHHPKVFKVIHKVHHLSYNPTPLAAFSFHPIESFISMGFIPIAMMLMPFYKYLLLIFFTIDFLNNIISHLGYEFYPKWFATHPITKYLNNATFHNIHHKYSKGNYGLYFTIWDRWMNTMHPKYEPTFHSIKNKKDKSI